MKKVDRAKQFLPFNSLRGYYDLVKKTEKIKSPKIKLAEEELEILSFKFKQIKKGMLIKVKYYKEDGYVEIEGMVSNIDVIYRNISIVKEIISFSDIIEVNGENIVDYL